MKSKRDYWPVRYALAGIVALPTTPNKNPRSDVVAGVLFTSMGRVGLEPTTLGLKGPCSAD